ncbi:membrane protein [Luteitalea sp. TBR-22]|uniref:YqaA family protein n=1 Tax=Luteitalea sp. TBR-22 TaxID=2802971 RepID=UPI001AF11DFA|nr:VTT domain-containing protein [Luteitalea sp. TBR-22]BCS31827.1 membrane protein [Luteitalea sp. TBR-22]
MTLIVLFLWAFAAATILPLSSEVPLAVEVARTGHWHVPVAVATVGNVLGAATTYGLARLAVTRAPEPSPRVARAAALLARYGSPVLLLSWVPLIGDVLVALAGAARMPLAPFLLWTTIGKAARYVAVAYVSWQLEI